MDRSTFTGGAISSGFSVYMVVNDSTDTNDYWFDGSTTRSFLQTSGTPEYHFFSGSSVISGTPTTDAAVIFRLRFDGASSSLFKDRVSISTGSAGTNGMNGIFLAATAGPTQFGNRKFAEFLIYDSILSSGDDDDLMTYLEDKYAL